MQDHPSDHQTQRMLRWAWALTALIALALCITTLSPGMPAVGPPNSDKWQHFAGFALLALPLGYARPRWGWQIIFGVLAFGAMIEVIQPFVGRGAEWADLAADVAGAAVAVLAMRLLRR
jgi:VanZ family protein